MKRNLIIGGPGTGKTTRLLECVDAALARGIPPERIAFVAFTKAAANEATERAAVKFSLPTKSLVYFRTLHSLCFYELGISRNSVMTTSDIDQLAELTGEKITTAEITFDGSPVNRIGDLLMTIDHYARTTMLRLEDACRQVEQDVDWFRQKRFSDAYFAFREDRGLVDYTDMLTNFARDGRAVPVDVAIVDEGQDLTALQWAVIERAFGGVRELWIAGDDDQSIYKWSGADEKRFLSLPYEREVLPVSHRLSGAVFEFGQRIIKQVKHRYEKDVRPSRGGGSVTWVSHLDEVDFSSGDWLALARTRSQLEQIEQTLRSQGVVYSVGLRNSVNQTHVRAIQIHENLRKGMRVEGADAVIALRAAGVRVADIDENATYTAVELNYDASPIWHDALIRIPVDDREYYLACRRRGEALGGTPRVRVNTIHGSKGMEASNVLLLTDLTYRVQKGFERDPDGEHKVFYVGTTRARETLTLLTPQSAYGYRI